MGAVFDRHHGKAKVDREAAVEVSDRRDKKKSKKRHEDRLVAAADRKGKKAPPDGVLDFFENMREGLCPNHATPVKHTYMDCGLMRKFMKAKAPRDPRKKFDEDTGKDD